MDFKTNVNLDNAAFRAEDETLDPTGLARILRRVAKQIEDGYDDGTCLDVNGNRVGSWTIEGGE